MQVCVFSSDYLSLVFSIKFLTDMREITSFLKDTTAVFLIAALLTCEMTFNDSTKSHGQLNHKEGLLSSKPHTSEISSSHATAVGCTAGS